MKISVFMEHIFDAAQQENCCIADILKKAASFGISGIELDYARLQKDDSLPSVIRENGLDVSCVYAFFDFSHNDDMTYPQTVISTLKKHNITKLMAIPGFIEEGDGVSESAYTMFSRMNKLTEMAEKSGISVLLEDFDDEKAIFSTAAGLLVFLKNVKNLGCAFDTGNFIYSGEDEQKAFGLMKKDVTHLHCKDRSVSVKKGETPKITLHGVPLYSSPVGYGVINIERIVKELLRDGYDGWFAIEHFGSLNQLSDMEKSANKLKEWYNDTCNSVE